MKRTVDEADETWQDRTTLLDDIDDLESDLQLEILKVFIQDNANEIQYLKDSDRVKTSQIQQHSSQIQQMFLKMNEIEKDMIKLKDVGRKTIAGDLVYMFQDIKGVDKVAVPCRKEN